MDTSLLRTRNGLWSLLNLQRTAADIEVAAILPESVHAALESIALPAKEIVGVLPVTDPVSSVR